MSDLSVKDKSLLFNTDLVETLEFDNLISQALTTMDPHIIEEKVRCTCKGGLLKKR